MRVVALVSGGKDSTFNMMQCVAAGHEIVALAYLVPHSETEIDSYMYQSVGHEAVDLIATALDLPLFKKVTMGIANDQGKSYEPTENDEVEDLYSVLEEVMKHVEIEAVSVGAILSDYQRVRVENVCIRLGLIPLAFLWQRNQQTLLDEMIKCEVDAIIIKVAALGLEQKHLGRSLSLMQPHLLAMHEKYGLNVCGEGGEYETLTLDCPLFKCRIIIEESEVVMHSDDQIAPVVFLKFNRLGLELKLPELGLHERLEGLPLRSSEGYITDDEEFFEMDDENEEDICQEDNSSNIEYCKSNFVQKATSACSSGGWLWIGGVQVFSDDPAKAMEESLSILKSLLHKHGHTVRDVCSVNMFICDMSKYAELNKLYVESFNHVNPPTRVCVEVPFCETCPVKLEAVSWKKSKDNGYGDLNVERHTMHVQSRSHWAPANIGPYSQAVTIGDFIHIAGQIGLIPGTLELVEGGIKAQGRLALRNIGRLLAAVDPNVNLRDVVQAICYVTDMKHIEPARKLWESRTNNAIVEYVVVTGLPKGALIEWHVWAHKHNNQFEYEERGKCVANCPITLYRRVNYDDDASAVVCRVEGPIGDGGGGGGVATALADAAAYAVQKLRQGHGDERRSVYALRAIYAAGAVEEADLVAVLEALAAEVPLTYTLVPALGVKNARAVASVCGVRSE